MATLYVRNLPQDVATRLQEIAEREGMSVNALTVRELTQFARAADNAARLDELHKLFPEPNLTIDDIVKALHAARAER